MVQPSQRPATKNLCKNPRLQLQFLSSWWWAVCRPKHVEQLRNTGIINSTTRSHIVGSFYEIYITMHGSMNIRHKLSRLEYGSGTEGPMKVEFCASRKSMRIWSRTVWISNSNTLKHVPQQHVCSTTCVSALIYFSSNFISFCL